MPLSIVLNCWLSFALSCQTQIILWKNDTWLVFFQNIVDLNFISANIGEQDCIYTLYWAWHPKNKTNLFTFYNTTLCSFSTSNVIFKSLFLWFIDLRLGEWQPWSWRSMPGWAGAGLHSSGCLPGTLSWEHTWWQRFTHQYQCLVSGYKKLASSLFPLRLLRRWRQKHAFKRPMYCIPL